MTGDQTYMISSLNMKRSLVLITATLLLVACTSELDQSLNGNRAVLSNQRTLFHATIEANPNPDTKVYADDQLQVLWNADDRISVFEKNTYNTQLKFLGEDGDNAGDFDYVGTPSSPYSSGNAIPNTFAVYPYASGTKISNDCIITFTLPAEQTYKQNSFGIGANTMIAMTTDRFLSFKNVGGYLAIRLYGDNISVSKITLKGNNGEKIAGKASISVSSDGLPSVSMTEEATDNISIVCDPPVQVGTSSTNCTDFWFVVPPTNFTKGFSVTVIDDKGGIFEKSTTNALDIKRNQLYRMEPIEVVPDYDHVFVPFEDANFKAYCVENFDTDDDGEISIAEAKSVNNIQVNTNNITSLGGIEYFTALKSLRCYGSMVNKVAKGQLTSLDVSNNTELLHLDCGQNQLTSLDVSNNIALTTLYCRNNQLTSLNVSKNTAFTTLFCDNNQLTSLDVSNNALLTRLDCYLNQITNLDVSHNTALTHLSCSINQLTNLDVSQNTALSSLLCDNNQLTSLDVSKNAQLTELDCQFNQLTNLDVSHNTALTVLWCDNNRLTELDVSSNIALHELDCSSNKLSSLDVNNNTALQMLCCDRNQLTSLDVSKNIALNKLNCFLNQLTSLDVSKNTELTWLYCYRNQLTILDVSKNTKLRVLSCSSNQLTSLDVTNNTQLTQLSCNSNQLTSLDVSKNTSLQYLYCDNNQLTSLDVSNNPALTHLNCSQNQLTSLDVSKNTALQKLYCYNNPNLAEIWLKTGQTIQDFSYDTGVATIKYK